MENTDSASDVSALDEARQLIELLGEAFEHLGFGTIEDFINEVRKMEGKPGSGVDFFHSLHSNTLDELRSKTGEAPVELALPRLQILLIYIATAKCVEAMRPGISINMQWWWVYWAHNSYGQVIGSAWGEEFGGLTTFEMARKGAAARHKENREMKAEVFQWLDENMTAFGNAERAAAKIAQGVAPVQHRTARDWIGQWKKARSSE